MPANTAPIFPLTPVLGVADLGTANTSLTGGGTIADLVTGGTNGTTVTRVRVQATDVTTAGMVRLWVYTGALMWRLLEEIPVTAATPDGSTGTPAWSGLSAAITAETPLVLPSGWKLGASTHNAETFVATADAGSY